MSDNSSPKNPQYARAILGAVVGAILGYLGFYMLWQLDLYAMVVPGALIGLGCGAQAGGKSAALGLVAGVFGLLFSLFIEWHFFPFSEDNSLGFFARNVMELPSNTKVFIAAGTFAAFWFGRGRERS